MFRQTYRYSSPEVMRSALGRYRPGAMGTFLSSVSEGFQQTPLMQGLEWLAYNNPRDKTPVSKNQFQDMVGNLPLQYEDGMTVSQVELLTKVHRREEAYGWFNQNVGMWEPSRIGGFLVGSVPDPLMLLPFGGAIARIGSTARMMRKGMGLGVNGIKKPIGDIVRVGSESALYAGVAEAAIFVPKKEQFQQPWGWQQALTDVAFAAGAGSSLAAFGKLAPTVINLPKHFKVGALTKVSKDLGDGELGSVMPDDYNPRGPQDPFTPAGPRHPEHNVKPEHVANQTAQESDGILGNAQKHFEAARANETFNTIRDSLGETADNILTPEFQKKVVDFTGSVVNRTADEFEKIINFGIDCIKKNK